MNKSHLRIFTILSIVAVSAILFSSCRHHHRPDAEHALGHLDDYMEDLELNAGQQQKYQEIRSRIKEDMIAGKSHRDALMAEIDGEFQKAEPDVRALATKIKSQMESHESIFKTAPDYFVEIYEILEPNQKAKVNEDVRDHIKWFRD